MNALFIDISRDRIPEDYMKRIEKLFANVTFTKRDASDLTSVLQDVDAIFSSISTKVDKQLMDVASKLKYIGVFSTAFDAVDVAYTKSKGITVCNLGGYSTEAVAEFAIASIFEATRELERAKDQAHNLDFSFDKFLPWQLQGKTMGVVGAGRIGSRIAELALGIGMKVIYFSRTNKPEIEKLGAQMKTLEEVMSSSDVLAVALALNKETEGMLNADRIGLMKHGSVMVNIAPPKLLDQEAVMARAAKRDITFIFDHSDDIELDLAKRYLATPNCIVYPPVAFRTIEANTARFETLVSNIENFLVGKPQNVVNS